MVDYNSTVLRLSNLTKEELYLLLKNLRNVFACGDESKYLVPDVALIAYLNHCANKIGDSYFRTPRNTIKGFLDLLSMLEQYPNLQWSDMIEKIEITKDIESTEVGEIIAQQSEVQNNEENDVLLHLNCRFLWQGFLYHLSFSISAFVSGYGNRGGLL